MNVQERLQARFIALEIVKSRPNDPVVETAEAIFQWIIQEDQDAIAIKEAAAERAQFKAGAIIG